VQKRKTTEKRTQKSNKSEVGKDLSSERVKHSPEVEGKTHCYWRKRGTGRRRGGLYFALKRREIILARKKRRGVGDLC